VGGVKKSAISFTLRGQKKKFGSFVRFTSQEKGHNKTPAQTNSFLVTATAEYTFVGERQRERGENRGVACLGSTNE
jgi:hypothetical protein